MSNPASATQVLQGSAGAVPSRSARAQAAIADAAQRTGVDFGYLLAQARIESGLNPEARARTSSATGLFQFLDQTWLATMDRHGEQLGFGQLAQAIDTSGGRARITDPAMRDAIMGLRTDPTASALMAGALAGDNGAELQQVLGRAPDASELYLAHFLGPDGASRLLTTLGTAPDTPAASLLPGAARANRAIFYEQGGNPRSVAGVMGLIRGRMAGAMEQGFDLPGGSLGTLPLPGQQATRPQRTFATPAVPRVASLSPPGSSSMADLIGQTFGNAGGSPAQAHVRRAYARLSALGM